MFDSNAVLISVREFYKSLSIYLETREFSEVYQIPAMLSTFLNRSEISHKMDGVCNCNQNSLIFIATVQ